MSKRRASPPVQSREAKAARASDGLVSPVDVFNAMKEVRSLDLTKLGKAFLDFSLESVLESETHVASAFRAPGSSFGMRPRVCTPNTFDLARRRAAP